LLDDIAISLQRAGIAFLAAVAFAIPLGLFMGRSGRRAGARPDLQLFRQTSALALYPVFILLLGLGEGVEGIRHLLGRAVSTASQYDWRREGSRSADQNGARLRCFTPDSLPSSCCRRRCSIFVGLRLSATTALLLLIASEMIGANSGVGFQVMNAQYNFQIPLMYAAIFLLAALGLLASYGLMTLQKRLCRWSDSRALINDPISKSHNA
jgi:sulfonate transport system permease protein